MKDRNIKLEAVTPNTLVVGVDIAKETQWARFVNYRGLELGKALKFHNNKNGFDSILASIKAICKNNLNYISMDFSINLSISQN